MNKVVLVALVTVLLVVVVYGSDDGGPVRKGRDEDVHVSKRKLKLRGSRRSSSRKSSKSDSGRSDSSGGSSSRKSSKSDSGQSDGRPRLDSVPDNMNMATDGDTSGGGFMNGLKDSFRSGASELPGTIMNSAVEAGIGFGTEFGLEKLAEMLFDDGEEGDDFEEE
ncbi:uncharacterized protein LOC135499760 isoform X2 [Lineus longissimus]|uniref:uncharacterized protein LOC135499760 isoform X2 n=1 Tax=Lineus longissimus TaxID=88925 RepID=UPI00315C9C69